jgi:hypothetical protein
MVCGAIVSSVALATGIAAAQNLKAEGNTTQTTVTTYKGEDALAYLPAYRSLLQRQLTSSDSQTRAMAAEVLHMLDQNKLMTFQLERKSFSSAGAGNSQLARFDAGVILPKNPINGESFSVSSCSQNPSNNLFFQTAQKYEYFSNSTSWIQIKDDVDRATTCPQI